MTVRCFGCGGCFADPGGEGHAYMLGSAGCWSGYGEVLAREYQDQRLFAACHRLTVDAYALQHPGLPTDRRAARSAWLHFASLHAVYEAGASFAQATGLMQQLAGRAFPAVPPSPACTITVADVVAAGEARHEHVVKQWARAAFDERAPLMRPALERLLADHRR